MDQETVISSLFPTQILSTIGNHSLSFPLIRDQFPKQPLRQSSVYKAFGVPGKGLLLQGKKKSEDDFFIFSGHFPCLGTTWRMAAGISCHSSDEAGNQVREKYQRFQNGLHLCIILVIHFLMFRSIWVRIFCCTWKKWQTSILPPQKGAYELGACWRFLQNKY